MILVVLEHEAGVLSGTSLEALSFAGGLGEPLHGVAFGEGGAEALGAAGAYGLSAGTHVTIEGGYAPAARAQALADLVASASPSAVVAAGTDRGNELLAHLGAKTGLPFVANCVAAERGGDGWSVSRQRWGGSLLEDALVRAPVAALSVALHVVAPVEAAGSADAVVVEDVTPAVAPDDLRARAKLVAADAATAVSLADARVVVGGGRGVGSAEGFSIVEALAEVLGGTVGVSRAVTSAGWRPHSEQVGQTGERIAPDIYIACGISGASQHMVGCRGAKKLVAINSDPDAPILAKADYAVIGDLREILPAITAEVERRRG